MADDKMHAAQKELFIGVMGNVAAKQNSYLKAKETVSNLLLNTQA